MICTLEKWKLNFCSILGWLYTWLFRCKLIWFWNVGLSRLLCACVRVSTYACACMKYILCTLPMNSSIGSFLWVFIPCHKICKIRPMTHLDQHYFVDSLAAYGKPHLQAEEKSHPFPTVLPLQLVFKGSLPLDLEACSILTDRPTWIFPIL